MHSGERGGDTAEPEKKLPLLPSASLNLPICHNSDCLQTFPRSAEGRDGRILSSRNVTDENL